MFDPERYVAALHFAAEAHQGQLFPGQAIPYVVHTVSVAAEILAAAQREAFDVDLAVVCALLHDTIEDTAVTQDAVAERFGEAVAAGVAALSKRSELPKPAQMDDSLDRILAQPSEIARVKLADRITNLAEPPAYWTGEKCRAYGVEAEHILDRLGGASPVLAERLAGRIQAYRVYAARP